MPSIDRLTGLPDDVICHILSFLSTKISVSTSVLAKRWRVLWTHVPIIDFRGDYINGNWQMADVMNRVMMLYKEKIINTLSIDDVDCSEYQLETWIIYAIQRSVRNLYIAYTSKYGDKYSGDVCTLPRCLFTCKTIVDLRLGGSTGITSTGEVFMPSLKKLQLSKVAYEDDQSLSHFLSGCPVLEELIINDCYRERQIKYSGCIAVSSPTLKTLNVEFSDNSDDDEYDDEYEDEDEDEDKDDRDYPDYRLMINAPALMYIKVNRCALEYVKSLRKNMASLLEAEFTLHGVWHVCDIDCTGHDAAIEFLSSLCHVKRLTISSCFSDVLIDIVGIGSMVTFGNLTKLELHLTIVWDYLVKFLEVAHNLEILVLNLDQMPPSREPEQVPKCMMTRLRTVIIYHFRVVEDCFDVVRYILRNASVLKHMEVYPKHGTPYKEKLDAFWRISLFEIGSKSCQLFWENILV